MLFIIYGPKAIIVISGFWSIYEYEYKKGAVRNSTTCGLHIALYALNPGPQTPVKKER